MNKIKFFKFALIAFTSCSVGAVLAQQRGSIYEVGMPTNVVPYIMLDEQGKATGFVADLLKSIAQKQNINFHFVPMPWSAMYHSLNSGDIDLISIAISTPERQRLYEESMPYNIAKRVAVVKDEALKNSSVEDLMHNENIRFVTLDGNSDFSRLANKLGSNRVAGVSTPFLELKSLITGKADVAYEEKEVMRYYQKKRKGIHLIEDENFPAFKNVFYAKKGNTDLINKINNGLEKITTDGTLESLKNKWFGK